MQHPFIMLNHFIARDMTINHPSHPEFDSPMNSMLKGTLRVISPHNLKRRILGILLSMIFLSVAIITFVVLAIILLEGAFISKGVVGLR